MWQQKKKPRENQNSKSISRKSPFLEYNYIQKKMENMFKIKIP